MKNHKANIKKLNTSYKIACFYIALITSFLEYVRNFIMQIVTIFYTLSRNECGRQHFIWFYFRIILGSTQDTGNA